MAVTLGVAAIGAWAATTERVSYDITHGVSMEPLYHQGDLVFVAKSPSYHVGQIVAYHGSTPGQVVLHRIIGGDEHGWIFKGDNNKSSDPLRPTNEKLIGRAVLHVPKGGLWLGPVLSPTGLGTLGFLIVGGGAAAAPRSRREIPRGRRKKKVKAMSRQGGSWATAMAAIKVVGRLPPFLRRAAVLTAVMACLGITLAVLGWMKPLTKVEKATAGLEQSTTFAYTAKVPQSAAYDGTTVTSPDPIFRKLVDKVDLHIGYHGRRGAFDVTAELTNGSGWHTTMQLAAAEAFTGASHNATVTLDLNAIDDRATAAATAIGVQPGPVAIAVTARVVTVGQPAFSAPLSLTLAPLELTLSGGPDSLSVTDAGASTTATRVMRDIKIFGHPIITAAQARSYAILLLLAALLGAAAIALAGRRKAPLRTRAEIERRYPQLLVQVEPMASAPGKPVILVDTFPALVRLAERYDQMILTWSRPDGEDFVVRDEGTTYRYRISPESPALENIEQTNGPPTIASNRRTDVTPVP